MTFLAMGGYAAFVWSAYGISAIVLFGLCWSTMRSLRRTEHKLATLEVETSAAKDNSSIDLADAAN